MSPSLIAAILGDMGIILVIVLLWTVNHEEKDQLERCFTHFGEANGSCRYDCRSLEKTLTNSYMGHFFGIMLESVAVASCGNNAA